MRKSVCEFATSEDGAITVEWVVLTAAVVGLAVSGYLAIAGASGALSANADTTLSNLTVGDPVIAKN